MKKEKSPLGKYLKPYRKETIIAPLFKLLEATFDLLVPIVVALMIDTTLPEGKSKLILYFVLLLFMAALGLTCSIVAQYFSAKASVGFASSLREALFKHIENLPFSILDKNGSNTLITRLTDDINQIQTGLNMGLRLLLRSPFIVFGAMIMAFFIDTKAAIIFALSIPILLAITLFIMKISIPLYSKSQNKLDRVTQLSRENLTGVRVIRAFNREEKSVEEFESSNEELTKINLFVGKISALLNPVTYVLINLATIILIKQSAIRVNIGALEQGQVVALYNYMLQIIVELIKLASLIITINRALACKKRVETIMNEENNMSYPEKDSPEKETNSSIEFNDVYFTYSGNKTPSLSGISFKISKGETLGIIGGTGSGKTTLINLIPRYYDRDSGTILINGKKIEDYTKERINSIVTVVPQKAQLFKGTIRSNMLFARSNATDDEIWRALEIAQAKEVVLSKKGELDSPVEQNGRNLSGGQKQRLTIARGLIKGGDILILDDSSSALDFKTDSALRLAISKLDTITKVIVSQRISSVKNATKIVVLDSGHLVGYGTHSDLLESCGIYQDIYYSQYPEEKKEVK